MVRSNLDSAQLLQLLCDVERVGCEKSAVFKGVGIPGNVIFDGREKIIPKATNPDATKEHERASSITNMGTILLSSSISIYTQAARTEKSPGHPFTPHRSVAPPQLRHRDAEVAPPPKIWCNKWRYSIVIQVCTIATTRRLRRWHHVICRSISLIQANVVISSTTFFELQSRSRTSSYVVSRGNPSPSFCTI